MGGRGGSSTLSQKAAEPKRKAGSIKDLIANMNKLDDYKEQKIQKEELEKKLPTYGEKVQLAYIDYVKKQTEIDLAPARDTYFDNRKGFNIDTSKLKPGQLNEIKRLAQKYPGGYEVRFLDNGVTRLYIGVERVKKK